MVILQYTSLYSIYVSISILLKINLNPTTRGLILGRGLVHVPSSFAVKSLGLGVRELKIQNLGFGVRELKKL